jgi:dihydroorotate dehydrogenase electron transfer subunit
MMPPVDVDATVIANVRLSRDYSVLTLAAPEVGTRTEPGQFVMLKASRGSDPLLRRPFSVFEVIRDAGGRVTAVSVLNKRAGRSTGLLYELEAGDRVACLGPLGQPFRTVEAPVRAFMVAGGVGLAPFATLAEALAAKGTPTTLFYGARSGDELFYLDFFQRLGVTLVLATEDGSRGVKGRVTLPLEAALQQFGTPKGVPYDSGAPDAPAAPDAPDAPAAMIYACGPEPMLAAVARLAARYGQPSQVSVERVMGCGLGGCYSCVVPVKHGNEHAHLVRSCVSGPVFDGAELVWD